MLQQLRVILAAEAEARQQVEAARRDIAALLQQAEDSSRRTLREARESRDAIAQAAEDRIVATAREQARQLEVESSARIDTLRQRAAPRIDQAAARVVDYLFGDRGQSDPASGEGGDERRSA